VSAGDAADDRTNADSRCVQPAITPRSFHRYQDARMAISVAAEITDAIWSTTSGSMILKASRVAEVTSTLKAAARGELDTGAGDTDKLEPVRTQPTLWELKWHYKGDLEYRLYHAEPEGGGPDFVGLRFHVKDVSDPALVEPRQNAEMQMAADRYGDGARQRWGHRHSPGGCAHCVALV
jgi:hypothetical protein